MTTEFEAPGCRDATIAIAFLLAFAAALFAVGLTFVNGDNCTGVCETAGLSMLYAGGPISAVFGVLTDTIVVAWPLDITLWVVLGFWAARLAHRRGSAVTAVSVLFVVLALAYGLVLSQFVELVG